MQELKDDFFLNTYRECKAAFIASANSIIEKFPNSERITIKINKQAGKIDSLIIRKHTRPSKRLILLSSGVHGVEGFVGSAIQRMILHEILTGELDLKNDVLFLHGINPYGFQNKRRVNEQNIDLNRNFFFKREKIPKNEKNKGYRNLSSFFKPRFPFTFWFLEFIIFALRFGGIMLRLGVRKFMDAAVNGQYEFKKGIYYGGKKPETVVKRLRRFFKDWLPDYQEILFLDFHTGYGEKNGLLLIQNAAHGSWEDRNIKRITSGLPLLCPDSGDTFYKTAGDFTDFLGRIFPDRRNIFPITVELGTEGNLSFLGALKASFIIVAENRIYHHGSWFNNTERIVKEKFLRFFYPNSLTWQHIAMTKTMDVCKTLFNRFEKMN
jgi:hypothetical protein